MATLTIPSHLLPADGRFGAGPSRVSTQQLDHLMAHADILGTSHRQAPVKDLVARVQAGLADFFRLPQGYEVVLGNGGSTAFWDIASVSLARHRSAHSVCGEFSSKCAQAHTTPWLEKPHVVQAEPGTLGVLEAVAGVDVYAFAHNETSTGVSSPVARVAGADEGSLMLVDATSAAGGIDFDVTQTFWSKRTKKPAISETVHLSVGIDGIEISGASALPAAVAQRAVVVHIAMSLIATCISQPRSTVLRRRSRRYPSRTLCPGKLLRTETPSD